MMATTRLSPGIDTFERDLTTSVPAAFLRQGAFAGNFIFGPADEPLLVSSESDLVTKFGLPNDTNFKDWFLAAEYLAESSGLRVVRIVNSDSYNAIVGGGGTGFTVDTSVVNGEVSSIALNAGGSGYTAGDIVEISGGLTHAEVRILTVDGTGKVLTFSLISNGTGYVTAAGVATTARTNFQIKNDFEFEQAAVEFPEIIAKYPGSYGNNFGVSVMRASEFYGNQFEDRFRIAPTATEQFFDGDGVTTTFNVGATTVADTNRVVTINNVTISEGAGVGQYSVSGSNLVVHNATEQFNGNGLTSSFTLANAAGLDLLTAHVVVDGNTLTPAFNGTGHVAKGNFDIDTSTKVLTVGTNLVSLSGDGVTLIYQITTSDTITTSGVKVTVGGTAFTVVSAAPNAGEVRLQSITGGYSFTFKATEAPAVGLNNINIEWGFPVSGTNNVVVTYGLPNGKNSLKVFTNQTHVHAVVYDSTGTITGTKNSVLERYEFLSLTSTDKFEDGTSSYYIDAINQRSSRIRISKPLTLYSDVKLANGSDGSALTSSHYQTAFDLYANKDDYDVTYLIDPMVDAALSLKILTICENRGDAVAFLSAPSDKTLNNKGLELEALKTYNDQLRSSSYGILEPTWMKITDRYNSKVRWIPTSGTHAGIYDKTHTENTMWTAAAGFNRGQLRRALAVSYLPSEAERDELYVNNINFIKRERGAGFFFYGQKTMLKKPSAFNRANVRFLSIYVKKNIADSLKFTLFEINDAITRANVRNIINPFMRNVQADRGVYEFLTICDDSNNTPEIIDANELKVDLYMKPTRTIEFIQLNLIFTKTGVAFEELIVSN